MLIGSLLSSTVPDRYIGPIAFTIFASGLKYVGVPTTALGWTRAPPCWRAASLDDHTSGQVPGRAKRINRTSLSQR